MQIGIWEDRKVFGSRGQILKEEIVGRRVENNSRDVKPMNMKLVVAYIFIYLILCTYCLHIHARHADPSPTLYSHLSQKPSAGNALEKIVSGYQVIYGGQTDEDAVLSKCRNAISCLEKADKEIGHDSNSGISNYQLLIFVSPICSELCICDSSV